MNETISAGDSGDKNESPELPETIELTTGESPENSVIWLHGLGADGHDFEPVVPMLGLEKIAATRFVFPNAPVRPVTLNGGMRMRAWYDIRSMSISRDQDEEGILHSATLVRNLIAREQARGITASRIILAGFSQGGAVAAHVALRYPEKLAGLMVLSAYLLFPDRVDTEHHVSNMRTPVFVGHGSQDPMVPVSMGRDLANRIRNLGLPVEWHEYNMPHSVIPDEISDIGHWLRNCLAG
jgi:phospholipase/carboxylesterase